MVVVGRRAWSVVVDPGRRLWPLVGHGYRSLVVGVGRWLWPLVVGRGRWPLVVVDHRHDCDRHAPVMSAAPSMAEGTASVEPAGVAEKAPTARPKAWRAGHFEVAHRQAPRDGG